MKTLEAGRAVVSSLHADDERSLLIHLELLLEREEDILASRDAPALAALAEERERVTARLGEVARVRLAVTAGASANDADLIALYERVRQRHDVRAQVVARHAARNARAIGVLAQATGQGSLYNADGRVAMQFVAL